MESIPVLIIGAGPTGLSMAIELNRYAIPFRIVDKHLKPVDTSNALAVQTRTLEIWDDIGLLQYALERGIPITGGNLFSKDKQIAEISFAHLKSSFHFLLGLSQHETEEMLLQYLNNQAIKVEVGVNLVKLESKEHEAEATLRKSDGTEETIKADWVIACDGGHSQVREACHVDFVGKELPQHFVLADLEITCHLTKNKLNLFTSPKGLFAIIPFNEKYSRIIADTTHDPELKAAKSLTFSQIKRLVDERCSFELTMQEPIWTSGFWIHARMAKTFQSNKIFFAGDAAHIHSPAGGQGMNTGIQDAHNLAWKLAWVIQGKANLSLLETYSIERESVARKVLKGTTLLTKVMTLSNPFLQSLRNTIMAWLLAYKRFQVEMTNTLTQLNIHYPSNQCVEECMGNKPGPRAGTKMLDVDEQLFEYVKGPKMTLICFMGMKDQADIALYYDLALTLKSHYKIELNTILIRTKNAFEDWSGHKIYDEYNKLHELYGAYDPCIYVIRPDKYVGFRGTINHLENFRTWMNQCFKRR